MKQKLPSPTVSTQPGQAQSDFCEGVGLARPDEASAFASWPMLCDSGGSGEACFAGDGVPPASPGSTTFASLSSVDICIQDSHGCRQPLMPVSIYGLRDQGDLERAREALAHSRGR